MAKFNDPFRVGNWFNLHILTISEARRREGGDLLLARQQGHPLHRLTVESTQPVSKLINQAFKSFI